MRDTSGKFTNNETTDKFQIPLHKAIESAFIDLENTIEGNRDIAIPFLCGAPGGGKTSIIKAECKARGWNIYARNMGMTVNEELSGIPELIHVTEGDKEYPVCLWSKPQIVSDIERLAAEAPTVIFFDDWHRTPSVIQNLAFESFTDYTLKGFPFPQNVAFILAGNDSVAAGARDQLSAVMNRVSKKYVKTDYEQWKKAFGYESVHPFVLGFLDAEMNRKFFHMEESMYEPWASPRSWSYLSKKIQLMEKKETNNGKNALDPVKKLDSADKELLLAEYASYVGRQAATELLKYYLFYRNVRVQEIFETGKYNIPDNMVEKYIFVSLVSNQYVALWMEGEKKRKRHSEIYLDIIMTLYKDYPEIGAIGFSIMREKRPNIGATLVKYKMLDQKFLEDRYNFTEGVESLIRGN
ncbi:MAG: ATP-binding protein [Ruminococcus flavefaciens]|nr:ATP-binding protein [Ruminococcus flavefaciens]